MFMQKDYLKKVLGMFSLFVLVLVAITLILLFNGYVGSSDSVEMQTCGDGTFYDSCSLSNPLFCENGILVEKASICGCNSNEIKDGDSCKLSIFQGEKINSFEYVLDGERKEIILKLYSGVNDYVKNLPRSKFYFGDEVPQRIDFKFLKIDDDVQKIAIQDLVSQIQNLAPESKEDQARIAISLVQNIPYGELSEKNKINEDILVSKFPYQVLYENEGSCEGKSELLVLLLRELDYGTAFFYYSSENHEAVGIKCPVKNGLIGSGYCFVETTSPSILGDYGGEYLGTGRLRSKPEVLVINEGISLPKGFDEYKDGKMMMNLRTGKSIWSLFRDRFVEKLNEKYGL